MMMLKRAERRPLPSRHVICVANEHSLDPVSCFVGRLSILREGTADEEPAATAASDNRPDSVVLVVGRRDAYDDRARLWARVGAAAGGGGICGDLVTQQFALMAGGCHGETGVDNSVIRYTVML